MKFTGWLVAAAVLASSPAVGFIETEFVDLTPGARAVQLDGGAVVALDFGTVTTPPAGSIPGVEFVAAGEMRAYPHVRLLSGRVHASTWQPEDYRAALPAADPLVDVLDDLVYMEPHFLFCHLTPGAEYRLWFLVRSDSAGDGDARTIQFTFAEEDRVAETPVVTTSDGRSIPGMGFGELGWAMAMTATWQAGSPELSVKATGGAGHLYGIILENTDGHHEQVAPRDALCGGFGMEVPASFTRYQIAGDAHASELLDDLHYRHYDQAAWAAATLWSDWLTGHTLWQASGYDPNTRFDHVREHRNALLEEIHIDPDGYVSSRMSPSYAHREGWPFPVWWQGGGLLAAWSNGALDPTGSMPDHVKPQQMNASAGWELDGLAEADLLENQWVLDITSSGAALVMPETRLHASAADFMSIRYRLDGIEDQGVPYFEWKREGDGDWSRERRMYLLPADRERPNRGHRGYSGEFLESQIPTYQHPEWNGIITSFRYVMAPAAGSGTLAVHSVFPAFDTRHPINNGNFVIGSRNYLAWTGDTGFLRGNINRMRTALAWYESICRGREEGLVRSPFKTNDGRPGFTVTEDGKEFHYGHGKGGNYWDILPFGGYDAFAAMYYYRSLLAMAEVEEAILDNPGWNIPRGSLAYDPADLRAHAEVVRQRINEVFWNPETGRYYGWVDLDGVGYDYGYTFLNLELLAHGIADEDKARSVLDWVTGERVVESDTSTGDDIYYFRFAPRASTKRNLETYSFVWGAPESIPFGYQVQDGGSVMGFGHYDLVARHRYLGPDNAWGRLSEILDWYEEVQMEGGYRSYYAKDPETRGTLQGGGPPGGLGIDREFLESVMTTHVIPFGFLGMRAGVESITFSPSLPGTMRSITVDNIIYQGVGFDAVADDLSVALEIKGGDPRRLAIAMHEDWVLASGEAVVTEYRDGMVRYTFDVPRTSLVQFVHRSTPNLPMMPSRVERR